MGVHENSDNVAEISPPLGVTRNGIIDDAEELCRRMTEGGFEFNPSRRMEEAQRLLEKIEIFRQVQVNFIRGHQSNGDR